MRKLFLCALLISSTAIPTGLAQAETTPAITGTNASSRQPQSADAESATTTPGPQEIKPETPGNLQLKEQKTTKPGELATSGRLPPTRLDPFILTREAQIYGDEGALPPLVDYGLPKSFQDEIKSLPDCTTCAPSRFRHLPPNAWY